MRVFWHNGALMIEPEGERESELLIELAGNLSFGRPSGMQNRIPSGEASSGDEFLQRVSGNHDVVPSNLPRKLDNKQSVVSINKLL